MCRERRCSNSRSRWRLPAACGCTFRLVQDHGGWNSDDNENNNLGRFRFSVTSADHAAADPLPADVRAIVEAAGKDRTAEQTARVFSYWRTHRSRMAGGESPDRSVVAKSSARHDAAGAHRAREDPRYRIGLERGNFLAPVEEVSPGIPAFLHPLVKQDAASHRATRLDFARWLADRRSPTTARSIVNRIWQAYFGTGLVATAEDLGTQGDPPSNPELLDWLAVELMDHNWSLKHIHRLIVNSATYQQSSMVTPQLLERDPANRLLARGPRYRVDAEIVRDVGARGERFVESDRLAGRAYFRPRRNSYSSRRPAMGRRPGPLLPGPIVIVAGFIRFVFARCRIPCCRISMRRLAK